MCVKIEYNFKEEEMDLDIESLRYDLLDYYGTAVNNGYPMAIIELSKIENATDEEIIRIAQNTI